MTTDEASRKPDHAAAALLAAVDTAERDARAALADARKVRTDLKDRYPQPPAEVCATVRARLAPVRARQLQVLTAPKQADSDARSARSG